MNIFATIALIFIALALCNKYSPGDAIILRKIIKIIFIFIIFIFILLLFYAIYLATIV